MRSRSPSRSGSNIIVNCDVTDIKSVDNTFAEIEKEWGGLDFVVHALAFSDRRELSGRYFDTTRENFINTHGDLLLLLHRGRQARRADDAERRLAADAHLRRSDALVPSYNVMGVAKAALEASCAISPPISARQGIRVNALSAGPMRTLAGAGISDARVIFNYQGDHAPLRRTPTLDEVGGAGALPAVQLSGAR